MEALAANTALNNKWLATNPNMTITAAVISDPIFVNCNTNRGATMGGPIKNHERYFPPGFRFSFKAQIGSLPDGLSNRELGCFFDLRSNWHNVSF
jgi:hypothetical protein